MKKRKLFLTLLLAVITSVGSFPMVTIADENTDELYYEENYDENYDDQEEAPETEHPDSYYAEIQSNNIEGWPQGDPVNAEAAILIDGNTGAVLYAKNIEEKEYPASITKIMTTLIALEKGNLSDTVKFSANAVYSIEFGSSHLGLTEGEELTLEQCLYGIMMASANEISNAVAEHIAGSIDEYVKLMNEYAEKLGCTNTHFVNVHGLHDENHYVCARDMALIMKEALKNEKFREIIGTVEYFYPETNKVDEKRYFMNHHKMIAEEGMIYDGCIGGKNGFTDEAMNTLVTAADRDGQLLIAVVLRVPGMYVSYDDTKVLLDYGFAHFKNEQITNTNSSDMEIRGIADKEELAKIKEADILKAPFSMVGSAQVTLPEGIKEKDLKKTLDFDKKQLEYSYQGQILGSVGFSYTGQWEVPTEAPETESAALTEAPSETEKQENTLIGKAKGGFSGILETAGHVYDRMDSFIKENTVIAAIIGGILLAIFIPLLIVSVIRSRKYRKIMALREEERIVRQRLEEELERKTAAQVEAELRARELQMHLEEEKRKRQEKEQEVEELENSAGFYLDEQAEEDEYIEVDPNEDTIE